MVGLRGEAEEEDRGFVLLRDTCSWAASADRLSWRVGLASFDVSSKTDPAAADHFFMVPSIPGWNAAPYPDDQVHETIPTCPHHWVPVQRVVPQVAAMRHSSKLALEKFPYNFAGRRVRSYREGGEMFETLLQKPDRPFPGLRARRRKGGVREREVRYLKRMRWRNEINRGGG